MHNGEINTLRGNVNWIRAREADLYSPIIPRLDRVLPIIDREGSDSAILDNVAEFLYMNGRSLPRAMSMLVPEPWDNNDSLSARRHDFDSYQSCLMEPWDGPAAIAFTDGVRMGAVLDRNGLRPARYTLTRDDRLILASETGVLDIPPQNVLLKGGLMPGQMLLVDPAQGRVVWDDEIKEDMASQRPWHEWIQKNMIRAASLPLPEGYDAEGAGQEFPELEVPAGETLASISNRYGVCYEDVVSQIAPMASNAHEPLVSMGVDSPLAVLSEQPRKLYSYFKQLFAQVTNPPIDALREKIVTSTISYLGNHGNALEDTSANCRRIRLEAPIIDREMFERICSIRKTGFKVAKLRCAYPRAHGEQGLREALDTLAEQAFEAVEAGCNILVLSDRVVPGEVPVPSLLALGRVHHHLIRKGVRTRTDLVVETGDAVSTHDFAMLVGYSASAVYPYLAHAQVRDAVRKGLVALPENEAIANFDKAVTAGIVSIMSKMGISTIQGYHSAQIFEAVGIAEDVVNDCFTGTVSRIAGLGFDEIAREANEKYDRALAIAGSAVPNQLPDSGETAWRPGKEDHLIDPTTIFALQTATRTGSQEAWDAYSSIVNRPGRAVVLRNLLDFDTRTCTPVLHACDNFCLCVIPVYEYAVIYL